MCLDIFHQLFPCIYARLSLIPSFISYFAINVIQKGGGEPSKSLWVFLKFIFVLIWCNMHWTKRKLITWNLKVSKASETVLVLASPITNLHGYSNSGTKEIKRQQRIFRTYFTQFPLPARCTLTSKRCFSVVLVTCSTSLTRLAKAWRNLKRNAQWHEYQNELGYSR